MTNRDKVARPLLLLLGLALSCCSASQTAQRAKTVPAAQTIEIGVFNIWADSTHLGLFLPYIKVTKNVDIDVDSLEVPRPLPKELR